MKRVWAVVLTILLAAPMALGILAGFAFYTTDEKTVPTPVVVAMGTRLLPEGYTWQTPVLAGVMYRDFAAEGLRECAELGELAVPTLELELPEGYRTAAEVAYNGEVIWTGRAEEIGDLTLTDNGAYRLSLLCEKTNGEGRGHGSFRYEASFTVAVEPTLEANATRLAQGDVLAIRISDLRGDLQPTGESRLGAVTFLAAAGGRQVAYLPIPYDCAPGSYEVTVAAGSYSWTLPLQVRTAQFDQEYLESWDLPAADPAAVSDEALAEFEAAMTPLYTQLDEEYYWEGVFETPAEGDMTRRYGAYRYIGQDRTPSRHEGIDIAAQGGAPVVCPGNGRVVFAGELAHTGNTIVVEHGGGLKSYFYHLRHLNVREGDYVFTGNFIGTAGSTGYATDDHLHYEVRIGAATIDPELLLNGASGLYAFIERG